MILGILCNQNSLFTIFFDILQRSLTSLELRDVISTAALPSQEQNISQESMVGDQSLPEASHSNEVNSFVKNDESSVDIADASRRQQQRRVHDPARDISIQVLEKFSLVTKFARDTTAQLFGESNSLEYLDPSYKIKKQEERKMPLKEPSMLLADGLSVNPIMDSFDVSDVYLKSIF